MQVDWITFCCVLIDRQVFDKIGLLDEQFQFMFEDVDFCKRAKEKGFTIECVEDAIIFHNITKKSRFQPWRIYWKLRGSYLFFKKHDTVKGFWKYVKNSILRRMKMTEYEGEWKEIFIIVPMVIILSVVCTGVVWLIVEGCKLMGWE